MALTTAQLTTLRTEVQNDPRGYGYAALVSGGNYQGVADALNVTRDGSNPPTNPTAAGGSANGAISINRGYISTQELVEAVVQSEMPSAASQRDWLIMVTQGDRVRVDTGSTARAGLLAIFGAGTTTRTNLTAAASRNGSRSEELFGVNVVVAWQDVTAALS